MRKRPRTSSGLGMREAPNVQRSSGWGPYSTSSTNPYYPQQGSTINLPPCQGSFITELGGSGPEGGSVGGAISNGSSYTLSAGLGGCQKLIEDGFFDNNALYNFTEENNFVQLLLFDLYSVSDIEFIPQPRTCYIDFGALKLSLSNIGNSPQQSLLRLQQEITFALTASFGISWPRFCMWNCSAFGTTGGFYVTTDNPYYYPQVNPVDDNNGDVNAAMFIQTTTPPMILCQLVGASQLAFSVNPAFQAANPDHDYYIQLMTPRTKGFLDQGTYPLSQYVNQNLVNGNNGWFEKGPYLMGYGFRDFEDSTFHDIYDENDWGQDQFETLAQYFNGNFPVFYSSGDYNSAANGFCGSLFLQKVTIGNMSMSLVASRYYSIRSAELSTNQVRPFISNTTSATPTDTLGILWDITLDGNVARDATGSSGGASTTDSSSTTAIFSGMTKEVNPMFCLNQYSLYLTNEWGDSPGNNSILIQGEDALAKTIKDSTVIQSDNLPIFHKLSDQDGNQIDPTIFGFLAIYNSYAPAWKTLPSGATYYDSQFSILRLCRNRTLLRYFWTLDVPVTTASTPTATDGYASIVNLWGSQALVVGEQKPAETSVHFMTTISTT